MPTARVLNGRATFYQRESHRVGSQCLHTWRLLETPSVGKCGLGYQGVSRGTPPGQGCVGTWRRRGLTRAAWPWLQSRGAVKALQAWGRPGRGSPYPHRALNQSTTDCCGCIPCHGSQCTRFSCWLRAGGCSADTQRTVCERCVRPGATLGRTLPSTSAGGWELARGPRWRAGVRAPVSEGEHCTVGGLLQGGRDDESGS